MLWISNLFSIFDPSSFMGLPWNWVSMVLILITLPLFFWVSPGQPMTGVCWLLRALSLEFMAILSPAITPGALILLISLFMIIVSNNTWGLIPYVFTPSSHLSMTVSLALPLWFGHMLMAWAMSPGFMLAHLVPTGTPAPLMPLMVCIEIISSVIRPLTLSVRLAANMVAGHLLLTLLSSAMVPSPLYITTLILAALLLLCVLESAVALIQAYVFSVLSSLYVSEVNYSSF